jgi:rhamnose transport system permease protein
MTDTRADIPDSLPRVTASLLLSWDFLLLALLALVFVGGMIISPYFLDIWTLSDATFNFSEKAIIALPMALLILTREIDLSVAAIIALCSLVMGLAAQAGAAPVVLIAVGLVTGLVCGTVNGALVTSLGLPSIVVTIATMSMFRGVAQIALGDQAITSYPAGFAGFGQGYLVAFPPLPNSFGLFLVLALVFAVVLHGTALGRKLYAMGNNPEAARFSGIAVGRIKFMLFAMTGLMAGLAAALLTSRVGSTRPNIALGWELEVITMVILGGFSITGGQGRITGVVLAVLIIGFATLALSLINVPGIVISVLLGFMLITTIALPLVIRKFAKLR